MPATLPEPSTRRDTDFQARYVDKHYLVQRAAEQFQRSVVLVVPTTSPLTGTTDQPDEDVAAWNLVPEETGSSSRIFHVPTRPSTASAAPPLPPAVSKPVRISLREAWEQAGRVFEDAERRRIETRENEARLFLSSLDNDD